MVTLNLTIGIDIGQKRDPTAIAVAEYAGDDTFACRFLERLPLGTPYPKIADRLREIVGNVERIGQERANAAMLRSPSGRYVEPRFNLATYVDATGVGQPIVDELQQSGLQIAPVYFTHGDRRTVEAARITLGKAWLVSRLQALLQSGRLALPANHPEAGPLRDELLDYEIRVSAQANDTYGAFRTGAHDDLVTALGLAVQEAPPDYAATAALMQAYFDGVYG